MVSVTVCKCNYCFGNHLAFRTTGIIYIVARQVDSLCYYAHLHYPKHMCTRRMGWNKAETSPLKPRAAPRCLV